MKIYISVDIEGISGVVNSSHTTIGKHEYDRARVLMTGELNAVINAVQESGQHKIVVNDSHSKMTNILIEELNEEIELITGDHKQLGMMECIDEDFDAAIFVGYHARHNTPGTLAHSYYGSVVSEITVNDMKVGEGELNALLAAAYDVPVIMISGDNVLSEQIQEFNPDIENAVVKKAISRYTARCLSPTKVKKLLNKHCKEALSRVDNISMVKFEGKVKLEVEFHNNGLAEATLNVPGVELIKANRVRYMAKDIVEAYRVRSVLTTLASTAL